LRRLLRDGRDGNRFIINIPGRGYSFVAPVEASFVPRGKRQSGRNFSVHSPHCDERLKRGDRHERERQVLQKTAISDHPRQLSLHSLRRCWRPVTQDVTATTDRGATRHRLDLNLAYDLRERVT